MNKCFLTAIFIGCSLCAASADQPAPAEKGLASEELSLGQTGGENGEKAAGAPQEQAPPENSQPAENPNAELRQQIADLQTELEALQSTLEKMMSAQKDLEALKGKIVIVEGENTALSTRIKTLEDENTTLANRVKRLEGDNAALLERTEEFAAKIGNMAGEGGKTEVTAARPGFVHSAVRFHNHEGRPLRMNVNGVWHTLKEGENDIWVPYGPVHIYRYTGAEPKLFWEWKSYKNGYIMEFDVGTPAN